MSSISFDLRNSYSNHLTQNGQPGALRQMVLAAIPSVSPIIIVVLRCLHACIYRLLCPLSLTSEAQLLAQLPPCGRWPLLHHHCSPSLHHRLPRFALTCFTSILSALPCHLIKGIVWCQSTPNPVVRDRQMLLVEIRMRKFATNPNSLTSSSTVILN